MDRDEARALEVLLAWRASLALGGLSPAARATAVLTALGQPLDARKALKPALVRLYAMDSASQSTEPEVLSALLRSFREQKQEDELSYGESLAWDVARDGLARWLAKELGVAHDVAVGQVDEALGKAAGGARKRGTNIPVSELELPPPRVVLPPRDR